ncbi:MAG TPA: DUF4265 domain-containing protein [Dermatophilaceae bacterium]|nr:DUF4265 domain-containing protein [Dermatophilaceae bacterium]
MSTVAVSSPLDQLAQPLDYVRVRVATPDDGSGWPPVASEGLWALDFGTGRYQIANAPYFADGLALGDVVEATADADGVLWAGERVHPSGHQTLRVLPPSRGWDAGDIEGAQGFLASLGGGLGVYAEPQHEVIVIDVAPGTDLVKLKAQLDVGRSNGMWRVVEGSVTPDWHAV